MTVAICVPTKGVCNTDFAVALRQLNIPSENYFCLYVAGADVAVARNLLAEKAMEIADYIFFLDDDVLVPINTLEKLLSHNKDIVCGLYFAKQEPHFPQIFIEAEDAKGKYHSVADYKKDSLIEIDSCGGGCLLIKAEVFKKLKKPYFQYVPKGENNPRKGEDFYFCEKARTEGYKIFCDTSIVCQHIGTKFVGPQHWQVSKERLADMEKQMGKEKFEEFRRSNYDN